MKFPRSPILGFTMLGLTVLMGCKDAGKKKAQEAAAPAKETVTIIKSDYGTTTDGTKVERYALKNENGMAVDIITYGGRITTLSVPDKNGHLDNVVLGFDALDLYEQNNPFFGALVGRYGNRIAKAKFSIDGTEYNLAANDGPNSLHGGIKGFDKMVWKAKAETTDNAAMLHLTYLSKDMEEGFPGNLQTEVTYTLKNDNSLEVTYEATTDKPTVLNLTQHSYFNLSGDFSKSILDHEMTLNANAFLPVDATLIPTGKLMEVKGTPFDFTTAKTIGKEIEANDDQLIKGKGYDHCWVLNDQNKGLRLAASAYHRESGRMLQVFTDEPGVQFYTGNFLDGSLPTRKGGTYGHRSGFCLETQHYPDSPNQTDFPSVRLNPGERYVSHTIFNFSTK
tara:strand:+ start:854 stop:2032 length:1179 start_codon:yes stop_codon:yes gene_type:complete